MEGDEVRQGNVVAIKRKEVSVSIHNRKIFSLVCQRLPFYIILVCNRGG